MKYHEFIDRVQERAGLDREEARKTTEAVLETLGEQVYLTVVNHMASELSRELRELLYRRIDIATFHAETQAVPLEQFYFLVAARAGVHQIEALRRTKAVLSVLREAVSSGVITEALTTLPEEYRTIFTEPATVRF
jgi:uncharacterized protein (DUF2267 family)